MALREIRIEGDPILYKKCREITEVTDRTRELAQDMIETMHDADGVGLAGPQVGILRRIVVIDVGEGPIVFINPKIVATDGEQFGSEGCLSIPGKYGMVRRPEYVKAENRLRLKAMACWRGRCAMNLTTWTVIFTRRRLKAGFMITMKQIMRNK